MAASVLSYGLHFAHAVVAISPRMPVSYDLRDINEWLDSSTLAKARDYAQSVSDLDWVSDDTLTGSVKGTRRHPYSVEIQFHNTSGNVWINGDCTCPVEYNCKHVAAVLIAGLEHQSTPAATGVRSEVVTWLDDFLAKQRERQPAPKKSVNKITHALAYVISSARQGGANVFLYKVPAVFERAIEMLGSPWQNVEKALIQPPSFVADEDLPILRGLWLSRTRGYDPHFELKGAAGATVLELLLATGRAFISPAPSSLHSGGPVPLRAGSVRHAKIHWSPQPDLRVRPVLQTEPAATMILTSVQPYWYVDAQSGEAGGIDVPWSATLLDAYLLMPPITPDEAVLVGNVLRDAALDLPPPPVPDAAAMQVIDTAPVPILMLDSLPTWGGDFSGTRNWLDFATVRFSYADECVDAHSSTTLIQHAGGSVAQIKRHVEAEQRHLIHLYKLGLRKISANRAQGPKTFPESIIGLPRAEDWADFVKQTVPALRQQGWQIAMSEAFRFNVIEIDAIDGNLRQSSDGWFDVELGITVGDRSVRLEPLLTELFRRDPRWLTGQLESINDDEVIDLKTERNERLTLRADRLKPIVRLLIDLFDPVGGDNLRISQWDAARLDALEQTGRWQFHGDASVRQLAQRLMGNGMAEVTLPGGLQAELRAYQREGLNWMQFLREHSLSGILADDMGLGKTVQTLAHLLVEKEAGRLDCPALIVMPTTLLHNWREEAARFAPDLRVLDLHGPNRHERFDTIRQHDIVLTTYALLWRDEAILALHEYHLLILDEAQYVKNVATKSASTIRKLRARHRLCLTGTPLENHLGELWAQFDFLLPGFLGRHQEFTKRWRTPIEKSDDAVRRELLARRIRPFMLRRKKDDVAAELPPKTMIVRTVELEGAQRDLYETVRAAMQRKVQAAVAAKGLARSHIIVLEALLKLRQVCCDPRLVNSRQGARSVKSAKLSLLLDMLPAMIEEGRRILLFSQFTGMLDLIATALAEASIDYVMLTGETRDRAVPVRQFMQGKVPLFLISLKAGGVGLNLTAADTVIHYDPWWNPAAENQATDRAHRIGQTKPVFVYKLITAGSVEEKIVGMQEKKAMLANAILSDDAAGAAKFSADDLEALFAPIPGATDASRGGE